MLQPMMMKILNSTTAKKGIVMPLPPVVMGEGGESKGESTGGKS